jgi:hypothetical protein
MNLPRPLRPTTLTSPLRVVLAAVLLTLGLVATGTGTASAADDGASADDVAWAVRTASNSYGANRQNFGYTADPGSTVRDAIVVTNHGKQPLDLAVYAADGFTTGGGQLDLLRPEQTSTGVGAWVGVSRQTVRVRPEQSVTVPFTLTLPGNATPGDYMGGIITSLTQPDATQSVNVDRRLAIRIRLRVGGELRPGLSVEGLHVSYDSASTVVGKGGATVDYTIHNTGNAIVSATQAVSVTGPFGLFGVRAADLPDVPELLPGESWAVSVPVDGVVPAGRVAATVRVVPMLTDTAGSTSDLQAVEETAHAITWWVIVALVVVVGALATAVALRRRRHRAARRREDARVQAAVDEALRERETSDR